MIGIKQMTEGWHFEKRINIGDFVAMIPVIAVIFWWATTVETRIAVLQEQYVDTVQNIRDIKSVILENQKDRKSDMIRLNAKIDQLLEQRSNK